MKSKLFFFSLFFCTSCDYYFDYKPLVKVEGKVFNVISFVVISRETSERQELVANIGDTMSFNDCDSKEDLPCQAVLNINSESIPFFYDTSTEGLFFKSWRETLENIPDQLPAIILTGNWSVKRGKRTIELHGSLGFKSNFPAIYGTHDAVIVLEEV